jgi:mRNA interferase RelE/StbE
MYRVLFTDKARKALVKMDKHTASFIIAWIRKNLEGCDDPRRHGKALSASQSGMWRYRIGDYRLITEISDKTVTVLLLNVGHRKDIYDDL